jgi:hypothetical protein
MGTHIATLQGTMNTKGRRPWETYPERCSAHTLMLASKGALRCSQFLAMSQCVFPSVPPRLFPTPFSSCWFASIFKFTLAIRVAHLHSHIHPLTHSFTLPHPLTHSHPHSLTPSFLPSLTHSLTHSLTRSLTHSLTSCLNR